MIQHEVPGCIPPNAVSSAAKNPTSQSGTSLHPLEDV